MPVRSVIDKVNGIIEMLDSGASDRKRISDILGISTSAVSTLTGEMRSHGIIGEYTKKDSAVAGKGTVNLYLRSDPVFAVCRIYPDKISTVFFGYNLKIVDKLCQSIAEPLFLDDCLISYFRLLRQNYPKLRHVCITADGRCDNGIFRDCSIRGLKGLPVADFASEFLHEAYITVENSSLWIPDHADGMNAVISEYLGTVSLSLIYNGDVISSKCVRIGDCSDTDGRIHNSKIRFAKDTHEYVSAVSSIIDSLLSLVDVDRIYLSLSRYNSVQTVFNEIESYLMLSRKYSYSDLPQFIRTDSETVATGRLLSHIRHEYIMRIF